ncbi:MAG TPA: hypothetical protein VG672_19450, partial [Bryobacteraceae bacterium]|nr:hypothetical protein [Bryobacteraceae bacterium]
SLRVSRTGLGRSAVALGLPVVLAVPLLILPQRELDRHNPWNRTFVSMHLLFMHARLTLPEIQRDRDDPGFTRYDRAFMQRFSAAIEAEFARAARDGPGGNYTLLYDPNRLLWGEASDLLRAYAQGSPDRYNEFCRYYFRRALTHHPLAYAKKVLYEWAYLFRPGGPMLDDSWDDLPVAAGLAWGRANSGLYVGRARDETRPAFAAYQAQLGGSAETKAVFHTPFPLNQLGLWVNRCFFPLWLIVGAASAFLLWPRPRDLSGRALGLAFFGSSLFLMAQLAPLAFVTTTCGGRAVQGLRTLSAFVTADLGLMSCVLLAIGLGRCCGWPAPALTTHDEPSSRASD